MTALTRALSMLGIFQRATEENGNTPPASLFPPRAVTQAVTAETALLMSNVYRAIEVLSIGVSQLGIDQWRGSRRITPDPLILKPDVNMHRPAFLEMTVVSLASHGNAYWFVTRSQKTGAPVNLTPLNPNEVAPFRDKNNNLKYRYREKEYLPANRLSGEIMQLQKMRIPGRDLGLSPIEAARRELTGAQQVTEYASEWFQKGEIPNGILTTDQVLSPAQAANYKKIWQGVNPETGEHEPQGVGVRVLGSGLNYSTMQIKPADVQFLETQQFNTTQIARLFGTPASLMLAVVDGNSQSYSNVEQDWIAFTRFTLMVYLREIEESLSLLIPHGNTVRFNVDALQRSDTKTRYEAHQIGINAGFLFPEEVRLIEGLDPLTESEV